MPKTKTPRIRSRKTPSLAPLKFGTVYCELCRRTIRAGQAVAWWPVPRAGGRERRPTAYCATCHTSNVRAGKPLW